MTARLAQEAGIPSGACGLVEERDGWACGCCGTPVIGRGYEIVPRLPLADGGTLSPENLVLVLGACLDRADVGHLEATGCRLRPAQDPAREPLALPGRHGARKWLTADGGYQFTSPEEANAA